MAQENKGGASTGSTGGQRGTQSTGQTVTRKRKVYDHVMAPQERFALQTVQRAQSALAVINDAIKSGKTVKPEIVDLCFTLSQAAGKMLFATS